MENMENTEKEKKTASNSGKKLGFLLLFAAVVLIVLGGVLMFIGGDTSSDTGVKENTLKEISHKGITLKTVSGYQYEKIANGITFYNSKYDFYVGEVHNGVMSDDEFNNLVTSTSADGSQVLDSGSETLSNGKDLKYIVILNGKNKFMMFYYNALDSYVLYGNVISDDYDGAKEEFTKVFKDVQIDSSVVIEDAENEDNNDTTIDDNLSGELEIEDNTVINSDSNAIQEDSVITDNNTEQNTTNNQ